MSDAETSTGVDVPDTVTVQLPRLEDFAGDFARLERLGQAMDLAGELTPEAFAQWIEQGRAIMAQGNREAPSITAGQSTMQGA